MKDFDTTEIKAPKLSERLCTTVGVIYDWNGSCTTGKEVGLEKRTSGKLLISSNQSIPASTRM